MSKLSQTSSIIQTIATCSMVAIALKTCFNGSMSSAARLLAPAATTTLTAIASGMATQYFIDKNDFKKCSIKDCATRNAIIAVLTACVISLASAYSHAR